MLFDFRLVSVVNVWVAIDRNYGVGIAGAAGDRLLPFDERTPVEVNENA